MNHEASADVIHAAVTEATARYLARRRARVKPFVARHFSWRGALRLNRRALGKDLLRAPANVLWAALYLTLQLGAGLARRLGLRRSAERLGRLPPGFKTDVEKEVEWLIYSELLELPFAQGSRHCEQDALFAEILAHPSISRLLEPEFQRLDALARRQGFHDNLTRFLRTYTASRTAAAELSGALLNLAAGLTAFNQFTPGTLVMGNAVAGAVAQQWAVSNFVLGSTLGSFYYSLFPAAVSTGLLLGTVGGLLLAMSVLTAGAGIVADPVQRWLGLHERKLLRLLDRLEEGLGGSGRDYRLRDAYVARVFDLWDLLQTATRVLA
jgi:hypothetical protein